MVVESKKWTKDTCVVTWSKEQDIYILETLVEFLIQFFENTVAFVGEIVSETENIKTRKESTV